MGIQKGVDEILENIISDITAEIHTREGFDPIQTDQNGYALRGQEDRISQLEFQEKMETYRGPEIPNSLHDAIFKSKVVARVGMVRNPTTGQVVENDGVLCHPKIADLFYRVWLAEQSFVEGVPSITFGGIVYKILSTR